MSTSGRVIQSTGSWYEVVVSKNNSYKTVNCRLPGRFRLQDHGTTNPIAVGDFVDISINEDDSGTIEKIHDRENYILRDGTHGKLGSQIIAANIDLAVVIQSVKKPKIKEGFINRFLVTCEAYQLNSAIIVNKMDLAESKAQKYVDELQKLYYSLEYPLYTCSIHDESSLETIKELLKDKTSVFVGPSGVGKTSILNHIDPKTNRAVGQISDYSNKGKHTTTFAKLVPLEFGGYLVDTPGIREFGLVNIEPWELSLFFPEMLEPREHCKFNNCTHSHEPNCGVRQALEEGHIDAGRYESYLQILDSLEE